MTLRSSRFWSLFTRNEWERHIGGKQPAAEELRTRWRKILKRGARLDGLDPQRRHKLRTIRSRTANRMGREWRSSPGIFRKPYPLDSRRMANQFNATLQFL